MNATDIIGWINTEDGNYACTDCIIEEYYSGPTATEQVILPQIEDTLEADGWVPIFAANEFDYPVYCDIGYSCNELLSVSLTEHGRKYVKNLLAKQPHHPKHGELLALYG